jgi:hypothetical protein
MPLDIYTKSLLHLDGSDGSTTITDVSGKTWTANVNAQIDTAAQKFGTGSLILDGLSTISTPHTSDFVFGSGDLTIDFWTRRAATGEQFICGKTVDSSQNKEFDIIFTSANVIRARIYYTNSAAFFVNGTGAVTDDGNFHHIALVRYEDSWAISTDGTFGSVTSNSSAIYSYTNPMYIGGGSWITDNYSGWVDEFRVKKGVAMWRENFTPPTKPYGTYPPKVIMMGDNHG